MKQAYKDIRDILPGVFGTKLPNIKTIWQATAYIAHLTDTCRDTDIVVDYQVRRSWEWNKWVDVGGRFTRAVYEKVRWVT